MSKDIRVIDVMTQPSTAGATQVQAREDRVLYANFQMANQGGPGTVSSVTVNSGGNYGSLPAVVQGGNGTGDTFAASMGILTGAPAAAGTGYAPADTITQTGGTESANGVWTVATTGLVSAAVNAAGTGYAAGDNLTLQGGTYTTPAVLSVATTKLISAVGNAIGAGYAINDTITLAGGTAGTKAILTVTHGQLASVAKNNTGSGYVIGEVITLAGGTAGTAAQITVDTVDGGGAILTFHISRAGDYTVLATTFTQAATSGAGTGATWQTGSFGVKTFTVSTAGSYTVNTAAFTQFATSGSGTGATFNTAVFGVNTITVASPGVYTANASSFTQLSTTGAGTGATFNTTAFGVVSVTATTAGVYTVLPANPVAQGSSSGSGTGATINVTGWTIVSVAKSGSGSNYDSSTTLATTGGAPVTAASLTPVISQTAGASATIPVAIQLPANYNVHIQCGQDAVAYADPATKTTSGFNIVANPRLAANAVAAGTMDVSIFA